MSSDTPSPFAFTRTRAFFAHLGQLPSPGVPEPLPHFLARIHTVALDIRTPLVFAALYLFIVSTLNRRNALSPRNRISGKGWTVLVAAHNLALAVFSAYTFYHVAPAVAAQFLGGWRDGGGAGFARAFCDSERTLWDAKMARFGYLFYLSKFYEVVGESGSIRPNVLRVLT
jgi:hypothetical protein